MPEPKKQSSPRKTGLRRSHLRLKLARMVNRHSPIKAFETKKQTPRVKISDAARSATKSAKVKTKSTKAKSTKTESKKQ
jgi:hypothetical protein